MHKKTVLKILPILVENRHFLPTNAKNGAKKQ